MSNFNCEKCGAICSDGPKGYVTGCEHYPPDIKKHKYTAENIDMEKWKKLVDMEAECESVECGERKP